MLGDQAFPAACERPIVERATVAAYELAQPEDAGLVAFPQQTLEGDAALEQRPLTQVGGAVLQQVEGDECDARGARLGFDLAGDVDASLQLLESGRITGGVERDDLAVEHDRRLAPARPPGQGGSDFGKL